MFSRKERQALKALAREYLEGQEETEFEMSDEKMVETAKRIIAKGGPRSYAEAMLMHQCKERKLV